MAAPRGSSEGSSSSVIVISILIVFFLVSTVFAIMFYVKNEEYRKQADQAQSALDDIGTSAEIKKIQALKGGSKGKTALGQLDVDMRALCQMIGGKDLAEYSLAGAHQLADKRMQEVYDKIKTFDMSSAAEVSPDKGLVPLAVRLLDEYNSIVTMLQTMTSQMEQQATTYNEALATKDKEIAALKQDNDRLSGVSQINKDFGNKAEQVQRSRYEEIITQLNDEKTQMQKNIEQMAQQVDKYKTTITQYDTKVKDLENKLAAFQPKPEMEQEALVSDGAVVSVVPQEKIAYINLGKNDHIFRGLTFSVYDSFQEIPKSGKGKGTLEVIEIMDNITKCRIVESDLTNPIMKKDIIANLIWDKNKKYKFCLVGDFDFDGDGKIDNDGLNQIANLIKSWGGTVSDKVSVATDFMVVGYPPELPIKPIEQYGDTAASGGTDDYNKAQQRLTNYKQVRFDGASLGVPTFNMSRFLQFIGYNVELSK